MMKYTAVQNISLLEALALLSPASSNTTLRSWIKEGRVFVDGEAADSAKAQISIGQEVSLGERRRYAEGNLRILYQDRHMVVIDKPEGVLSVATAFEKGETAHAYLKTKFRPSRVFPVHRLDQETSGVMLFALSEEGRDALKEKFEKHDIERFYTAIVEGHPVPPAGTWKSYQHEDANYYVHNSLDPSQGKPAITHYEVKKEVRRYSLLELHLETGRKNQIRAHCLMAGYPIAGDKKYGSTSDPGKRVCLHAHYLGLAHPITGKRMTFTSPLPKLFSKIIDPG